MIWRYQTVSSSIDFANKGDGTTGLSRGKIDISEIADVVQKEEKKKNEGTYVVLAILAFFIEQDVVFLNLL